MSTTDIFQQAESLYRAGNLDRAAELCLHILGPEPDHREALLLLGTLASRTGRFPLCVQVLGHLLEIDPQCFDALIRRGIALQQLGDFNQAEGMFKRAVEIDPESFAPYIGILRGKNVSEGERGLLDKAIAMAARPDIEDDEKRQLDYGIAKSLDDLGNYQQAIGFLKEANVIAGKLQLPQGFDRELHSGRLNQMIAAVGKSDFAKSKTAGSPSAKPVYIVGMIRSGTTLVEQIISRHPDVFGGGEMRFWIDNGPAMVDRESGKLNWDFASPIQLELLALLERIAPRAKHVTDKMPMNYMLLGLIYVLFPEAPIVHIRRNPADTCLSIFMTPYAAPPDFAYDLNNIAFAYREYQRTMDTWRDFLPAGKMLEIDYETLVSEPDSTIRQLIAHCGLSWDDRCLSPELNERVVNTPSRWQVRQPLYRKSIGRARHYSEWLGPVAELDPS